MIATVEPRLDSSTHIGLSLKELCTVLAIVVSLAFLVGLWAYNGQQDQINSLKLDVKTQDQEFDDLRVELPATYVSYVRFDERMKSFADAQRQQGQQLNRIIELLDRKADKSR